MKTLKPNLFILLFVGLISITGQSLQAQQITVRGTVTAAKDKQPLPGAIVHTQKQNYSTATNEKGKYSIKADIGDILIFRFIGMETVKAEVKDSVLDVSLKEDKQILTEATVTGHQEVKKTAYTGSVVTLKSNTITFSDNASLSSGGHPQQYFNENEEYGRHTPNKFQSVWDQPLSTFSIDVDVASYGNMRRFLNNGQLPPKEAIRTEELINYFTYNYPEPKGKDPVSITTEVGPAPWNRQHRLLHVGIKAKKMDKNELPSSNLVFLIDISGSMNTANKLPLVKASMKLLVHQLREEDRVAIVTYANQVNVHLSSTSGSEKETINAAIEALHASGGTAGGQGIQTAYKIARQHFMKKGNNRIILATDGDFNIGVSRDDELEALIEKERNEGVFLTVLGYGMGNYKDKKMQILAEKGNGNHAYIDNIQEAKKVLVNEFCGTLFTIAKDVKIQVEFNPSKVQAYRLIGYESRMLEDRDFNDDTKDAGEMGVGHTVTALYEIIPAGIKSHFAGDIDPLKYQKSEITGKKNLVNSPELLTIKLRYKEPDSDNSSKMEIAVRDTKTSLTENSEDFRFSAAVAGFGMLLQHSPYQNKLTFQEVIKLARESTGKDPDGYRKEFVRLAESAALIK